MSSITFQSRTYGLDPAKALEQKQAAEARQAKRPILSLKREMRMVGAPRAGQQKHYSISRRAEAGLTVLDAQCVSQPGVAGENSEAAMEAQQLIDSIEQDIQRMRIDEALKASLVARLDELRRLAELDSQSAL